MNISVKQKQMQIHREQTCGCQVGGWGEDSVFGISRRKLVYIGWIKKWSYSIAQGAVFNTL